MLRLKQRLQFTGYLQYLLPPLAALLFSLSAAIAWGVGAPLATKVLAMMGAGLLAVSAFDILTVRLHLHPREPLPQPLDQLDAFDVMLARRACRSFQSRRLTPEHHRQLMEAVRIHSAPPDCDLIGTSPIRFEYVCAPLTVWPVVGATEFLVAIAPSQYERLAVIDVGRNLQKVVIEATRMGLATCWIGPGADQGSVADHLGDRFDPEKDHIICVCAVGYKSWYKPITLRAIQALQRRRLPLSSLFFADAQFKEPLNRDASPFSQFGRTFEVCQWSPSSFNGQPTRCVAVMERDGAQPRLLRFDFYATTASRYYAPVALGIWCADWELGCEAVGVRGRFAVLAEQERGEANEGDRQGLARYDVSWVMDQVP